MDKAIHRAFEVPLEKPEYIDVDGVLFPRGEITAVGGPRGLGKSSFNAWVASRVSRMGLRSLTANGEDRIWVTRARIQGSGGDLRRSFIVDLMDIPQLPDDLDRLEGYMRQTKADVIMLDPAALVIKPPLRSDQPVRQALMPLGELARKYNAAIILIAHLLKHPSKKGHPLDALPGNGIANSVRMAYLFGVDPHDPEQRALYMAKHQYGPDGRGYTFSLTEQILKSKEHGKVPVGKLDILDNHADLFWYDMLPKSDKPISANEIKLEIAEIFLLEMFHHEKKRLASDIVVEAEKRKISRKTYDKAKAKLGIKSVREGGNKKQVWWWVMGEDKE